MNAASVQYGAPAIWRRPRRRARAGRSRPPGRPRTARARAAARGAVGVADQRRDLGLDASPPAASGARATACTTPDRSRAPRRPRSATRAPSRGRAADATGSDASSSPSRDQHRPGGGDRVDALVRPRAVRGAPAQRDLRPHEALVGDDDLPVRRLGDDRRVRPHDRAAPPARRGSRAPRRPPRRRRRRASRRPGTRAAPPPARPSCRTRRARTAGRRRRAARASSPPTPTVSRCPHSSSVRPPPRPVAHDHARPPGVPSSTSTEPRVARPAGHERRDLALPRPARDQRRVHGVDRDQPREQVRARSFMRMCMMPRHERRARRGSVPAAPLRRRSRRGRTGPSCCA